jgi:hypothetical protein
MKKSPLTKAWRTELSRQTWSTLVTRSKKAHTLKIRPQQARMKESTSEMSFQIRSGQGHYRKTGTTPKIQLKTFQLVTMPSGQQAQNPRLSKFRRRIPKNTKL